MNHKTIFLSLFKIFGVLGGPLNWGASNQAWFDQNLTISTTGHLGTWSIRSHRNNDLDGGKIRCGVPE